MKTVIKPKRTPRNRTNSKITFQAVTSFCLQKAHLSAENERNKSFDSVFH